MKKFRLPLAATQAIDLACVGNFESLDELILIYEKTIRNIKRCGGKGCDLWIEKTCEYYQYLIAVLFGTRDRIVKQRRINNAKKSNRGSSYKGKTRRCRKSS